MENFLDERALARPRYTSNAYHQPEREGDVDVLEIVLTRADDADLVPTGFPSTFRRQRDVQLTPQVVGGE